MATVRTPGETLPARTYYHVIRILSLLFLVKFAQGQGPGGGRVLFDIAEGLPKGHFVGTIATQGGYTYTFNENNPYFLLDQNSGTITTSVVLDLESLPQNRIDLLIVGRQTTQSSSYPIEVTVKVIDINDNAPKFSESSISITIPENAQKGTQTLIDTATDPDEGVNGTVGNYQIIAGNEDGKFILVEPQQLSPYMYIENVQELDRETKDFYQLRVSAEDGGSPRKAGYLFINLTIQDVNDNPPIFDHSDYTASINESAASETSVIRVHATDRDKGRNADITYSISDETNQFTIDTQTGEISNLVSADQLVCHRECQRSLMSQCHARSCFITVEAHDGGKPSLSGRAYISVNLIDENDHEPNISFTHMPDRSKPYSAVDENVRSAQVVAIVSVLDADQGLNGQTTLTIIRGNEQGHFKLLRRGSFNLIQVDGRLDRERTSMYNLTLMAVDEGSPPKSSVAYLIIYVNDVNDHTPEFQKLSYSQTLSELAPVGSFVASVVATDLDSGVNAELTYSILSGDDHGWFKIDRSTGLVTTSHRLDFETTSRVILNISATDGAITPHKNFTTLTITLFDENDMSPTFSQPVINVNITEGTVAPVHVATLIAEDNDGGNNGTVSYYLHQSVDDKYPGTFRLVSGTARIETIKTLDREDVAHYTLYFVASDQGSPPLSSTATINLNVLDVNDNAPVFYPEEYYSRVFENQQVSTSVEQIRCTDLDEGKNGEVVYSISEGDRDSFDIDPLTGLLTTRVRLDRERRSTYTLTITAHDQGEISKSTLNSAIVHIVVGDMNDVIPVFVGTPYTFAIVEDGDGQAVQTGRRVGSVKATTEDTTGITYSVVDGDPNDVFMINSMSGKITTRNKVDREIQSFYKLMVVAAGGVMFSSAEVTITVDDLNDNFPIFASESQDYSVLENSGIGFDVCLAKALDLDDGPNAQVSYTLQSDAGNTFSIRPDTGIIFITKSLNMAVRKSYNMVVTASDAGTPRKKASMQVNIHVKDVNDHTPTFPYQNYEVSLLESQTVNDRFFVLTASDGDFGANGEIVYNITRGNDGGSFGIFPDGVLYVARPLDRETRDFYRLTVSASDRGEVPRSASMNMTVHILDDNDNRPLFLNTTYSMYVEESVLARTTIGSVSAIDKDIGRNAEISYSLATENKAFSVNLQTGEILTLESFDREKLKESTGNDFISFEVRAIDNGETRLEDRATVNVYITDVNDNAPRFSKQLYSIPLHEQAPVNSQVLKVSASDLDTGLNSYISYSLVAGDGLETFDIDAASGVIILTSRIDRETKDMYHLTVMASDNGKTNQNSATASVRISIVDDNDNFPQFVQTLLETHLLETTLPGHVITQFVASDSDIANNAAISYTITSGNVLDTFSLDFTTGKLYLDKPLDYEAKQSYALNITAEDFGSPRLSSYIRFIVNVDDYNDNPPSFPASPIMKQVTEGPFVQSPVVKVTASDPDSGINRELRYSIVNQDPPGNYFRIDSRSGMIYINSEIDREFSDQFNITVVATDQAEPPVARKSSQKSVLIIVKDRNDNAPEFVSMPAVGVSPNSPSSTQIMTISAQDADVDKNGLVRYRLVTADRSLFALDSESGLLYLSSALPAQPLVHRVTVRAEDQGVQDVLGQKNTNMEITIFVRSATANGPTFDQASFGGSVYENRPRDTFILEVSASSTTSASVKYYITKIVSGGVEQPQYFQIDENLGTLSTTKPLDREMGFSFFDVEVYAVETNGAGPKTRSVQVQIELKDENGTPPKFSQNVYNFEIPETQLVGTSVATVTVEDSDVTGEVTLSIAEGNANGMFRIDDNGRITNLKVLDRETKPSHWLKVRASDGVQESIATVNIVLLDINDHAPRFPKSSFSFDIPEDTPLSTTVASVMATDEDAGKNGHVTYLLVSDWGRDVFQLHPTRGTFTLIGQLDFEQVQHYILTVRAVDGGDPALTSDLTLYMNIVDVNDNVPVFDPMSYQGEVWENTYVGTSILTVRATDTDSEANAEIEYWIVAGDLGGDMSMGVEDGVIRTARPLDRETHATYSLTVMAVDRAVPPAHLTNKLNSTAEVIIHVRDVNDEAPVFVSSDKVWVKENSVIGEAVFTVSAVDQDDGRNADVEYTLVTQNSPFSLGRNSGKLIPQKVIDREKAGEYVLEITATDKGSKPQTATTKLQVYVEDVNDNNPVFDPRRYQKTVAEDTDVGTSLLQVTASDKDSGFNGVVRYFIIEGDDNRDFRMDHSSGTLRVQKSLDYERKNSYILVVQAEDSGVSVRYDTATVTVGITDVNDNAPVFFHSPYHAFVQENQQDLPVHAIQVSAHDEDSELNSQVTYTLRDGDRSKFDINSASGEVTVLQTLDREASSEYLLVVIATDSGTPPLTGTGTISVIVQDVNDNTPAFQHQNYFGSIEENLDKYSPVMRVKALDGDEGMNAEIRYSLVAGAEDRFTIDPATGTILTMTSLDREEREQYNLVVLATDGGFDPRSASTKVTIAVDDVNDNQPRFEQPQYTQEILDPTEPGDFVLGVTAVDRDSGPNGKIHYELYGGDSSAFHLDPHSGIITAKSRLTKSTKSVYRFQVRASDTAERPLTVQTSVTVQFSSAPPSSRPRFTSDPQTSPLKESLSVSHPVTTVQAVSARSSLINYFIAGGNVGQTFAVDPKSGAVTVAKSLDYELTSSYNLWIEARDLGSPLVSQYKPVVIDIVDENDNIPRFSQQYRNISISEDRGDRPSNLKRPVLRLTATDLDSGNNGKVRFQISSGNIENAFSMNAETGEIKTNGKIDRERVQHYSLQITAIDQGSPSLTASASVDVYVEDVNDNPPQFTRQSAVSIPENTEIGAFVLRATSTDNDIGENARVIYSLGRNPDERFRIDPDSGNITVNGLLDAELKNVYNIEVVATDLAYRPSTPVTITIQDVNDNAPVFNKSTFNFYFNEGQSNNAFVGRVNATDSDITSPNNQFYFSLERPSSIFHLDTNMGNIYSLKTLHFVPPSQGPDSSNRYELDILATDLGVPPKVSKAKVVITVVDANDHAPTFSQRRYFSAVEEMVTAQEVILNLNASDNMDYGMNAEVEYLKDGGNGSTLFDVDPTSGALSVSRSLSGLRNRDLIVTVRAQDKGIKPRSSRVDVQLRVTGINRYAPRITTTKLDGSLPEDVQPGSLITTIQATDDDAGINGEVQFSVTGGNDYQLFSIDEVSGSLTVAKPLDFDTVQTHYINITAKDRAFRSKSTTVTYVLKLSDVNDNAPVFNQSRYNAYIQENSANSTWVYRAHATDRDSGAHAVVEYSIISDTDARTMFTIESRSGIIRLFGSLDFEVRKEYTMTVLARNPGVQNLRNTTTIVVHVTGKNEFVPHFRRSSYEFRTSKSAGRGTSIGSVSASDNDDGEDGIVYYFLVGASNLQGFRIDMRTGNITVGGSLATSSALVTLTVLAKNSGSIKGNDTDTCEVRITVQAVQSQPCGDKYCQNGGECIRTGGDFVCKCPDTWSGPSCSTDVNECNDSPCKPEEVCRNTDGSFYCECAGNQGSDCGQTDDFCRKNNPCRNGGTCKNEAEGYRCECGFGYWGPECQHQSFSFTDGSYLESPPLDAFQNHITLYFATVQTKALLLFNPGQSETEFMALEILDSTVNFSYAVGGSQTATKLNVPVSVSDGRWYKVEVTRGQQTSSLKVSACPSTGGDCDLCRHGDSNCHATALAAGRFNAGGNKLTVGGVRNFEEVLKRAGKLQTFQFLGCMRSVVVEGQDILLPPYDNRAVSAVNPGCGRSSAGGRCNADSCSKRGECVDEWTTARCDCDKGYAGDSCEQEWSPVSFGADTIVSYVVRESYKRDQMLTNAIASSRRKRAADQPSLSVRFLTTAKSGVLVYTAGDQTFGSLLVKNSNVVFTYKLALGGEMDVMAGGVDVTTGEWHQAAVTLTGNKLELSVDGSVRNSSVPGLNYDLTGSDMADLSLGGAPSFVRIGGVTPAGFTGCMEEFLLDGEVLPFSGHTDRFTIEVQGDDSSTNCPAKLTTPQPADDKLSPGIIVVIVFFALVLVAIVVVFVVCRSRRALCWKAKVPDDSRAKHNGTVPKHGNDTGGNRSQDSGYSGDNNEVPEEVIIRNLVSEQMTLTHARKQNGILSGDLPRPDIIDSERRSTIPMPLEIDDGTVIIENGDLSHIPHSNEDIPEHYDLENASSIAPSDIDVVTHYKGFRDGKIHKYKTNPHVPSYHKPPPPRLPSTARSSPMSHSANGRSSALSRGSQGSLNNPPVAMLGANSPRNSPLAMNNLARSSPASQSARNTPLNHLSRPNISSSPPGYPAHSRRTTPISGVGCRTDSECSMSSASTGRHRNAPAPRSRPGSKSSDPYRQYPSKPPAFKGLTVEEVDRLNARPRGNSPVSMLDAVSSTSDDNVMFKVKGSRQAPAQPMLLEPPDSTTDESANDSFTCSEFEYDNDKVRNDFDPSMMIFSKLTEVENETDDHNPELRPFGQDGRDSRGDSYSELPSSEEERFRPQKPLNGQFNWDYLLNWGPSFEKLVGVFKDIALLPDGEPASEPQNLSASGQPNTEEYV